MQPKWTTHRKPNEKESALVADIKRRHGNHIKIKIAETPIYCPRKNEPPPSPEAVQAVEKALAAAAGVVASPDKYLDQLLNDTLNKLDCLPPLRESANSKVVWQERKSRKTLRREVDQLKASVAVFKQAYDVGYYNRAIVAYGFVCNLIQSTTRRFDDQELFAGRQSVSGGVKANKKKRKTARRQAKQIHAHVKGKMPVGGFTATGYSTVCLSAAKYFDVHKRTIQRATENLKPSE